MLVTQDREITIKEIDAKLPARRNLIRLAAPPLTIAVITDTDAGCTLDEITEVEFDALDITEVGVPTVFCKLASDLYAIWPTPQEGLRIRLKLELSSAVVG